MKTKVYSAFPGVGKTTYFNTTDGNVLDKNWDNWMDEMDNQEGCHKVKIESGQYLTDVID
jgi:adenylate kinase